MKQLSHFGLQALIFTLVSTSFVMFYLVQPVLPVLQVEFGVSISKAAQAMSAVTLGVALSSLIFGRLVDLYPTKPFMLLGGIVLSGTGLLCSLLSNINLFIGLRLIQGLFIPTLTSCLAAWLARNLPAHRLNVTMGAYVSATVVGSLGGRLLGGWVFPPQHWRYAFAGTSVIVLAATLAAALLLPPEKRSTSQDSGPGFLDLMRDPGLMRMFAVGFGALFIFGSVFNYLPFYLSAPPFSISIRYVALFYLTYLLGVVTAPLSGTFSNRLGNGRTIILGALTLAAGLLFCHASRLILICLGLSLACAGFFAMHAAAVGGINRKLSASRGRANSLYMLWYYLGGSMGITITGQAFHHFGWAGVTGTGLCMIVPLLIVGLYEQRAQI